MDERDQDEAEADRRKVSMRDAAIEPDDLPKGRKDSSPVEQLAVAEGAGPQEDVDVSEVCVHVRLGDRVDPHLDGRELEGANQGPDPAGSGAVSPQGPVAGLGPPPGPRLFY